MTNKQPIISITRRLEFDSGHRIPIMMASAAIFTAIAMLLNTNW
uniref:Uncharacterized protein n=1 Tax=Polynucleobacter necessarius subsp. necessarius (strain STIR1) TaxID=452638 RepID=B1XTX5_POLNS